VPTPCCEHLALTEQTAQTTRFIRQSTAVARFAVLTAVLLRIRVFWDVTPCGWVFALKMKALLSFETSETLTQGQGGPIFFLSFDLLIGWQLSICNCYKPLFSLLYNCQLLCFWRLALRIVVEVFLQPLFPDIAPSRMFTTNLLSLTVRPIHEWRLFFLNF
jgi:hypothetical protein